jgi:glycosyltransferase involved in cell wall biosynthesis
MIFQEILQLGVVVMNISILVLNACDLGGIERSSFTLVKTLKKSGHLVELVSLYKNDDAYLSDNEDFRVLAGKNELSKIFKYIKNLDEDTIIISTYDRFSFLISILRFFIKKKITLIAHQHADYYAHRYRVRLLRKLAYKAGCDKIVCLTQKDSIFYRKWFDDVTVIPNIFDAKVNTNKYIPVIADRNTDLLAAGRLHAIKRYTDFIKLHETIHKSRLIKSKLFGHGEEYEKLKALSPIAKDILKGATKNIFDEMIDAKILIVTSLRESFSMVIVEAMAAGCVVISYDCPTGPGEIITDQKDGFLVQNGNFNALYEKCMFVLGNKDVAEKVSLEAQLTARNYYPDSVVKKWNDLFHY